MYQNKYHALDEPTLVVCFYRSGSGAEPVRDWLCELPKAARKAIGEDMKTVQFGWPLGMPLVRKMEKKSVGSSQSYFRRYRTGAVHGGSTSRWCCFTVS